MDFYYRLAALIISVIVACLTLGVMHYYPHNKARTGKNIDHPDRLTGNYKNGILALFLPFSLWMAGVWFLDRESFTVYYIGFAMWLHIGAGGFSVRQMYAHDERVRKDTSLRATTELLERKSSDNASNRRT